MADNVTLPGTGALVAADELVDATLGTVKVQYVKIMDGTIDGSTKAAVGTGGLKVQTSDTNGNILNSSGPGFLRVTDEPSQLLYDPFDGNSLDTTNRWSVLFGGGANPPSQTSGQAVIDASSTSGGWSTLYAQNAITPTVPAWLGTSFALNLSDGAALVSTGYRFWGVGTIPAIPTVGAPITDGVGFEVTGGKMYAVVYASGVRTVIQDMSVATGNSTAPTDANNHRYILYVRTDRTFWYVDSLITPVATSSFQSPTIQTLPVRFLSVSGGSSTVINSPGVSVWDTGKNSHQLSDGQSPWRKVTIKAANTAAATTDLPIVTAFHPSTPLPSGTNMIGMTVDPNMLAAKSADAPVYMAITGNPDGDFAGLNLIEQVIDDTSGLGLNVKIINNVTGQARITNPPAVADGQKVSAIFDKLGKQIVVGAIRDQKTRQRTNIAASTAETTIITSGGIGVFNDLYGLIISNNGSAVMSVTIRDVTGGIPIAVFEVPATDTRGMMLPVDSAIPQTTAASAWTATCTPNATSVDITALYVKNI